MKLKTNQIKSNHRFGILSSNKNQPIITNDSILFDSSEMITNTDIYIYTVYIYVVVDVKRRAPPFFRSTPTRWKVRRRRGKGRDCQFDAYERNHLYYSLLLIFYDERYGRANVNYPLRFLSPAATPGATPENLRWLLELKTARHAAGSILICAPCVAKTRRRLADDGCSADNKQVEERENRC